MDTILVFSTSIGRANADMLAGVREFAKDAEWNVQSFVYTANFRNAFRAATGLNPLAWRERSVKNA